MDTTLYAWINNAIEMMKTRDFEDISVNKLSSWVGLTRGSFYHHFKNEQDFFFKVGVFHSESFHAAWMRKVSQKLKSEKDPTKILWFIINQLGEEMHQKNILRVESQLKRISRQNPELKSLMKQIDSDRISVISELLEKQGLNGDVCEIAQFLLQSLIFGSTKIELYNKDDSFQKKLNRTVLEFLNYLNLISDKADWFSPE